MVPLRRNSLIHLPMESDFVKSQPRNYSHTLNDCTPSEETCNALRRKSLREISNLKQRQTGHETHRKTKSDTNKLPGIIDKIEVRAIATRRNSLTHSEATLLNAVQTGDKLLKRQTIAFSRCNSIGYEKERTLTQCVSSDFLEDTKLRYQLSQCIDQRRSLLTKSELSFLESLSISTDISIEVLKKTILFLEKHPLYNITEDDYVVDEKEVHIDNSIDEPSTVSLMKNEPDVNLSTQDYKLRNEVWSTAKYTSCDTDDVDELSLFEDNEAADGNFVFESLTFKARKTNPVLNYFFCFLDCIDDLNGDKNDRCRERGESKHEKYFNEVNFHILGTSIDDIYARPHILSPPLMDSIRSHMPYTVQQDNFFMKYSLIRDGSSLRVLMSHVRNSQRTVLAIETYEGEVFGVFVSSPWRSNGNQYYGNGEAFLWRLRRPRFSGRSNVVEQAANERNIEVFPWTGLNRNIQLSNPSKIIVGGGEPELNDSGDRIDWGFGLALNNDLSHGSSSNCCTFGSPCLSQLSEDGMFTVANIEVWTMTPVATVKEAEHLEVSRAFIFEHSEFLEN